MKRFFTPNNNWKFEEDNIISDNDKDKSIKKHFEFFNWTLSFTKNCVQACFILFVIANLFIVGLITVNFVYNNQLVGIETYITEMFNMFVVVVGGYIVKAAIENSVKITMSVLSDWLIKRYKIKNNEMNETTDESCEEINDEGESVG